MPLPPGAALVTRRLRARVHGQMRLGSRATRDLRRREVKRFGAPKQEAKEWTGCLEEVVFLYIVN